MQKYILIFFGCLGNLFSSAQQFEIGMQTITGPAYTTFKGDLATMVGFSELEITEADIDTAFAQFDINAPRWVKELFPGLRIEVDEEINQRISRNVKGVRFYARFAFAGASLSVSDPRLATPPASRQLKNQIKSLRLSLAGKADELAEHLALLALEDENRVKSFFANRYDLEAHLHVKQLLLGSDPLVEWGNNNSIDVDLTTGIRFSADPSPILDLGSILFVSERIDSLLEGGLLAPVENITDDIALAIQHVVFGKFRDPRVVPSMGWFVRGEGLVNFGGGFSIVLGTDINVNKHLAIKGTQAMFSIHGYLGARWQIFAPD